MKRPCHSVADLRYLAMKCGKWSFALFYVFIHLGNFLVTNGESYPKWTDQVETQVRFTVQQMPGDIKAKLSFDRERNALAILMSVNLEQDNLKEPTLLMYNFEKDTRISISGHSCDDGLNIERGNDSIQFLETTDEGERLKDFGHFLFFDPEKYAEPVSEELTEINVLETKWVSTHVPINMSGVPPMYCNLTHYITNVHRDDEIIFSHIAKIEGSCLLNQENDIESDEEVKIQFDFFLTQDSISNSEVFQQPPGVYCPSLNTTREYPSAPPYFSFSFLAFDSDDELGRHLPVSSFRKKIWFDSPNKLIRKDNLNWDFDIIVTMISDFNSKLSYIIQSSGECAINELKAGDTMEGEIALPGENFPLFPGSTTDAPQYVGQRKRFGITFDVWVGRNQVDEVLQVSDYYFTDNILSEDNTNVTSPGFIEMFIFNSEGKLIGSALQFISEYRTKPSLQDQSVFDVTSCFPESNKTRFSLTIASKDGSGFSEVDKNSLINEVQKKLLSEMKVSKMRLGALQISFMDEDSVSFISVLSEDPTRLGFKQGKEETSNKEAMKALDELINDKNLLISVDTMDTPPKKISLTATKLSYHHETENKDDKKTDDDKDTKGKKHGFSGGALAGVGIAMLAVGMFQGIVLLVAYIRYRRNDPLVRKLTTSEEAPDTKPSLP